MALQNRYRWEFPLNSEEFIRVFNTVMASGVLRGFSVVASSLPLNLDVTPGAALCRGALIENDDLMVLVAGVAPNGAGTRRDIVVLEYIHGGDPSTNVPRIKVVTGDANEPAPLPSANQIVLATITLPPNTSALTDEMISQAPRITQTDPGRLLFARNVLEGGEFVDTVHPVEIEPDGKSLSTALNLKVTHAKVPADLLVAAARLALEGLYPGNFTLSHTYNEFDRPASSTLTLQDVSPAAVITLVYGYDANQRLTSEVIATGSHTVTVTYGYTGAAVSPTSITQEVASV